MLSTFGTFTLPSYMPLNEIHKTLTPTKKTGKNMAIFKKWLTTIRRKFVVSPQTTVIIIHSNAGQGIRKEEEEEEEEEKKTTSEFTDDFESGGSSQKWLSEEELAAIKIQAFSRGHLARHAFRALKSLVKLQALVRGVCVRRQARIALHCMHTLVQLHVKVRARQLLTRAGDAQLLPLHP
ncbi:IQ-domain 20 [Tasmannia lanceolata]|uniref:IQ-domain 20 n=1 Tax=Tasmannia lanceolata TaxID=3420 RepID=UPI004062BFFF